MGAGDEKAGGKATTMNTPAATPTQEAFARRHGFRQNPATGTYEATAGFVGEKNDLRVAVCRDGASWAVLVEGTDLRGALRFFDTAKEAWTFAIEKTTRILTRSGRELRTFG